MEEKNRQMNRCLREPILLYESTSQDLPAHVKRMLVALHDIELTQTDRLVILAYILMVEAGFLPVHAANHFDSVNKYSTFNITHLQSAEVMPNGWKKSEGVYSMNFVLPVLPDHALSLIAQTAGNIVVFSACLEDERDTPSWCIALDCDKYVMRVQTEFMTHRYFNLRDLSLQFKNKIPLQVRNFLKLYGNVGACSLLDLPEEILVMILGYLTHRRDIVNLSRTCVTLHELCLPKLSTFGTMKFLPFRPLPFQFSTLKSTIIPFSDLSM